MKKLNSKGFTLIELLAVITILGILMLVAIPAISRTIENSRKDTFMDTAKLYVDAVRTSVSASEVSCNGTDLSAMATDNDYYVFFCSDNSFQQEYVPCNQDLMQSGGKSSWANKNVYGYVRIHKGGAASTVKYTYYVAMTDGTHGVGANGFNAGTDNAIEVDSLKRAHVGDYTLANVPTKTEGGSTVPNVNACVIS